MLLNSFADLWCERFLVAIVVLFFIVLPHSQPLISHQTHRLYMQNLSWFDCLCPITTIWFKPLIPSRLYYHSNLPVVPSVSSCISQESYSYTGWGKSRFTFMSIQNIVYSCIINTNNCKLSFSQPCIKTPVAVLSRKRFNTGRYTLIYIFHLSLNEWKWVWYIVTNVDVHDVHNTRYVSYYT